MRYEVPRGRLFRSWRRYLLSKKDAKERYPFDPQLPVYFVGTKMFAIFAADGKGSRMNLKCDPDWSRELRRDYAAIRPGYHMNKKHWNTIVLDGNLPRSLVKKLVDCSYDLVAGGKKVSNLAKAKTGSRKKEKA